MGKNNWDERYRKGEHAHEEPHPLAVRFASTLAAGRALDIACGTGRHAVWLAERGWEVTAVDNSSVAIEILRRRSNAVNAAAADLERGEFLIESDSYDLIIVCNYLQWNLFPSIRTGTRRGGIVVAIIAMADDDPGLKPMNPAYLVDPGELRGQFPEWEILHDFEGKRSGRRAAAEIVARKPITMA